MKTWRKNDIYNVADEFNRIESDIQFCIEQLELYYDLELKLDIKTDWSIEDIPDVKDIIRIKSNINELHKVIVSNNFLDTSEKANYSFNYLQANAIETRLYEILKEIGQLQFQNNICGVSICGNNMKLNGVI